MIFYTRELHEGVQDSSGWTRKATIKFHRNIKLYREYFRLIAPYLPKSALQFATFNFHDAELIKVRLEKDRLSFILDTAGCFKAFPDRYAYITFSGVHKLPKPLPKKNEWWVYDEFHLAGRNKFCFHLMFTETDIQISADEISLKFRDDYN